MLAARRKIRLTDRRAYERYARALKPIFWLPMQDTGGTIATNRMYAGGVGPELLTNGSFTNDGANWTITQSGIPGVSLISFPDDDCQIESDGTSAQMYQQVLVKGNSYESILDVLSITGNILFGGDGIVPSLKIVSAPGLHRNRAVAQTNDAIIKRSGTCNALIASMSIRKIGELDAEIGGTTSLAQSGQRGTREALLFDGATSRLTIYNRAALQGLTGFTLWMLFRPTSAGENNSGTLFSKNGEFELRFNSASRDLIATVNYSTTNAQRVTSTTLSANEWHSVGMRIENTGKVPEIFVDGVEASYASTTPGAGSRVSNTSDLIIGNNVGVSATLAGLIDEALMISRDLTASELRQLHLLAGLD